MKESELFQYRGNMMSSATRLKPVAPFAKEYVQEQAPSNRLIEIGGDNAESVARRVVKRRKAGPDCIKW